MVESFKKNNNSYNNINKYLGFCFGSYYLVIEFPFSVSYFQVDKVDKNDIKFSK